MYFVLFFCCINADVVVAPPFVYIEQVKKSLTDRIEISAQNVWIGKGGAFTGEIRLEFLLPFLTFTSL
jgi:triosephosphate isomerase (TIM)